MRVEIFDQTYHLRGDVDEAYTRELAAFVDEKLRAVAAGARAVEPHRVAVMAALNIADELFTLRRRTAQFEQQIRPRAERALACIEQALQESA